MELGIDVDQQLTISVPLAVENDLQNNSDQQNLASLLDISEEISHQNEKPNRINTKKRSKKASHTDTQTIKTKRKKKNVSSSQDADSVVLASQRQFVESSEIDVPARKSKGSKNSLSSSNQAAESAILVSEQKSVVEQVCRTKDEPRKTIQVIPALPILLKLSRIPKRSRQLNAENNFTTIAENNFG